jgi:dCTP deaminase
MTIKSDKWIRRMAASHNMIEPFAPDQVRVSEDGRKIVSYGTSSYGYDIRCAECGNTRPCARGRTSSAG